MEQDLKIVDNVIDAFKLIKSKEILLLFENNHNCYFFLKNDKIMVIDSNAKYSVSYDDFLSLYKNNKFVVYENKEEEFDYSIDEQYYSWKHK